MEGHCGGTFLNSRCVISTFKKYVEHLLDVLSDESREMLRDASLLQLFLIPDIPQNIPLLYRMLRLYNSEKKAFLLGQNYLKFTVNEVALILGLPNRGEDFEFRRTPYSQLKQNQVVIELQQLASAVPSPDLEERRVNSRVRYALCKFLFPLKSLTVPDCLEDFGGLDEFRRFNWPKDVHSFLQSQFNPLHKLSCKKGEPSSLGYLEGCTIVLVVWLFEHTKIQVPVDNFVRQHTCRWSATGSFSNKFCLDLYVKLWPKKEVYTKFVNIFEEHNLLGGEEVESSFESLNGLKNEKDKRKQRVEKEDQKKELLNDESERKRVKEMNRYISREVSHLRSQLSEEIWQLHSYLEKELRR